MARAEQILRTVPLNDGTVEALEFALETLIYVGRLSTAMYWCDILLDRARSRHAPSWQALFSNNRADIAIRQGDLETAVRHARAAMILLPPPSWGVALGSPLATLLLAFTWMTDHKESEQLLEHPVPEAMFQTRFGLRYLHARGHHYLATKRTSAGLRDFLACGDKMISWGIDAPELSPWRTDAAQAHLALNQVNQARQLAEEQLDLTKGSRSRAHGVALRVLAGTHPPERRPRLLTSAVDILQACGDRLELAHALSDLGQTYEILNATSLAHLTAQRARHVARDCHAEMVSTAFSNNQPLSTMAETEPEQPTDSVDMSTLTLAERRVATLAAQGYTNREISKRLYITVSTIEQHLTRVYRKLNVRRRTDLPNGLEESVTPPV